MSGETIVVRGTAKALETGGVALASGSLTIASGGPYSIVDDGSSFPDAEFILTAVQFGTAPVEGSTLLLYAQPLAIDGGTANTQASETTRPTVYVGSFTVNDVTSVQNIVLNGIYATDVPIKAFYYLYNYNTGQQLASGWKLTVTPRTRKPAP